jgi:hypothetical protein
VTIAEKQFQLIVDLEGGHYFGRWECLSNGQTGAACAMCNSIDDAFRQAQWNAEAGEQFRSR